jgi:predicted nucleic-acid-binding protein
MIGLDTHVLVRNSVQDAPKQSPKATTLMESLTVDEPGFIATVILLRTKERVVERADHAIKALRVFSASSADFADCLIERAAAGAGCLRTTSVDKAAAKTAGMTLVQ